MRRVLQWTVVVLVVATIAQAIWQHGHLPPRVAAHFDAAGRPNGWMSRDRHLAYEIGLTLFFPAMMGGLAWLVRRLPASTINIPNRDYWLAPERRGKVLDWVGNLLLGTSCFLLGFFMILFDGIYRANLTPGARLALPPWILLGAPAVFVVVVLVATRRRFGRREPD